MGRCGAVQNILLGSQVTNGAPPANAPLVTLVTNGAPAGGAPLVVLQKSKIYIYIYTNGALLQGAH